MFLTAAMVISTVSVAAFAAEEHDIMPISGTQQTAPVSNIPSDAVGTWAAKSIERWSSAGIVKGDENGNFNPSAQLSRAELAQIFVNMFGLTQKAPNTYADLKGTEWYADAVLKCTAAGIMKGDGVNANAEAPITRQETAAMTARALGITVAAKPDFSKFTDGAQVADWAAGTLAAMVDAGIIAGIGDGTAVAPRQNIDRASTVNMLDKAVTVYANEAKEYTITEAGIVVVTAADASIKGGKITGSLVIAEGVGEGNVTIDGVNVAGQMVVRGGGKDSIHVKGNSTIASVSIARTEGAVRVVAEGNAKVEMVTIDDGKDDVIIEGTFGAVNVTSGAPVTLQNATVTTVTATAENANLTVDKGSKVTTVAATAANSSITVAGNVTNVAATADATGVSITVAAGGTATSVVTAAPSSVIANDGKLGTVSIAKDADTKYIAGDKAAMPKFVAEDKTGLTVTTAAAEKAAAEKAAAEKALAEAATAEEKAAAEAAKAAADKAAADAKAAADKAAADAAKKTEEKPVTPPTVTDDGKVEVPEVKPQPPVGGGNSGPSALAITVVPENFNTHKGADYKGISVGYKVEGADVSRIASVSVALYAGDTKLAENTSKASDKVNTAKQYSCAFIVEPGTYYTSSTWNFGAWTPAMGTVPSKAVVTITDTNGYTYTATNTTLSVDTATWESLFDNIAEVATLSELNTALNAGKTMITVTASISDAVNIDKAATVRAANAGITLSGGVTLTAPTSGTLILDGFKITKQVLVNANANPGAVVLRNNDLTMADDAAYGTAAKHRFIVRVVTSNSSAFNITMDNNTVGNANGIPVAPNSTVAFLMNNVGDGNAPAEGSTFNFTNNSIYLTALHTIYNVKATTFIVDGNSFVSGAKTCAPSNTATTALTAYNGGANGTTKVTNNTFEGYGYGVKFTQYDADPVAEFPASNTLTNNTNNTLNAYYAMTAAGLKRGLAATVDALRVLGTNNTLTLTENVTIPEGKTLEIPKGKTLEIGTGGSITNDGTIIVNDEAGLKVAVAVGGNVKLGTNISMGTETLEVNKNVTIDGKNGDSKFTISATSESNAMAGYFIRVGAVGGCTLTLNNVIIDATNASVDGAGSKVAVSITPQDHLPGNLTATNTDFIVKGNIAEDAFAVQVSASNGQRATVKLTGCTADCVGGKNESLTENARGYVLAMNTGIQLESLIDCAKENEGMFDFFTVAGIPEGGDKAFSGIVLKEGMRWREQSSGNKEYRGSTWQTLMLSNVVIKTEWPQVTFNVTDDGKALTEADLWFGGSYQDVQPTGTYIIEVAYLDADGDKCMMSPSMDGSLFQTTCYNISQLTSIAIKKVSSSAWGNLGDDIFGWVPTTTDTTFAFSQ